FTRFVDDYEGRLKNWRFAMDESARLRDELAELITSGEITARLKPL
ncbi:MAG: patatin-like phospholipase family protein, partial [Rhodocyclaceae bacterium]|nr:patatin-like phospholipase family protein [Rhodocyclaceae bacterium]MCA3026283.1 patatin-like phospholipase family protein [Rhodocyclaceae bacterium]MCA3033171.1 patatin-like phospholipase family protein [Rhodocyclaceae bacterium]